MKTIRNISLPTLFLLAISSTLVMTSCFETNADDDMIDDLQLNLSIDEYPTSGDVVGTLSSNLTGTVVYELISESVSGAFILINGNLTVGDWLLYDYESVTSLTALVEATNGSETQVIAVEVMINDVDDISAFLSDSRSAYESATVGDWVPIIESEYNDLANYLAEVTKSGATDAHFANTLSITSHHGGATVANDNGNTLPVGSYLFAFKYYSWANNVVSSRIKLSQGDASGPYEHIGNTLPEHNDEYNFFVLKGADTALGSTGYLSMYASLNPGWKAISGTSYKWVNGDLTNLDNTSSGAVYLHQGLSTTIKQWD